MDPLRNGCESRLIAQWIEQRIRIEERDFRRSRCIGSFQPVERNLFLAERRVRHGDVIKTIAFRSFEDSSGLGRASRRGINLRDDRAS